MKACTWWALGFDEGRKGEREKDIRMDACMDAWIDR